MVVYWVVCITVTERLTNVWGKQDSILQRGEIDIRNMPFGSSVAVRTGFDQVLHHAAQSFTFAELHITRRTYTRMYLGGLSLSDSLDDIEGKQFFVGDREDDPMGL